MVIINYIKVIADTLNPYSNLLIAVLTIGIVYLTFHSLRTGRETFRFNALPIFFPKISVTAKASRLILENHSNYPAFDVDLWIIGEYQEDEVPYKSLLSKEYKNKVKINFSKSLYGYKPGHYGIVDHIIHCAFPPKARCIMDLEFIIPPETLSLVLQFRDSIGYNYLYQSWLFMDQARKERRGLTLGSFTPQFKPAKRIEYPMFGGIKDLYDIFRVTDFIIFPVRFLRLIPMALEHIIAKIRLHLYLERDIKDSLLRSFPSGYQESGGRLSSIEGRGNFTEL